MITTLADKVDDAAIQAALAAAVELKLEQIKEMPLVEKIWHMQIDLGRVEKHGMNEMQKYKYLRESDLVAEITKLASKYRVLIIFRQVTDKTEMDTELKSAEGKPMTGAMVVQEYDIINIDKPEETLSGLIGEPLRSQGYSADRGDKSLYKAKTGAKKYALTDTFMVASGDDPEGAGASDGGEARGGRPTAPRATTASRAVDGPATEEQVKLWANRKKSKGIKSSVAITSIGKALNMPTLALAPGQVADFLRSLSHRDMGKVIAALDAIKIEPPAATAAQEQPAAAPADSTTTPPRVPSA